MRATTGQHRPRLADTITCSAAVLGWDLALTSHAGRLPRPTGRPLTLAALGVVIVGALLPATPVANSLGFQPLPGGFFAALAGMVIGYLILIEIGKTIFYRAAPTADVPPAAGPRFGSRRHVRRRAAHFSTG